MPHSPFWEYTLHHQKCAKNHTITANKLLAKPVQNCVCGQAKAGFLKAASVGPALLPRGDGDHAQEELADSNSPHSLWIQHFGLR